MLEHVIANISFTFSSRGDLKLTLISPHGTPSEILSYRKNDHSNKGKFIFNLFDAIKFA
jgi:subtilisin-like proprotein convertase family protein